MARYTLPPVNGERPVVVLPPPPGAAPADVTSVLRAAYHAPAACRAADATAFAVSCWNRRWALFGTPAWAAQAARDAADMARVSGFDSHFSPSLSADVLMLRDLRVQRWTESLLGHDLNCEDDVDCPMCAAFGDQNFVGLLEAAGLPTTIWRDYINSLGAAGFVEVAQAMTRRAVIAGAPLPADLEF